MTNQEWLMTLSVDDLVEAISNRCKYCAYFKKGGCPDPNMAKCRYGNIEWLKQEHKKELKPCPFCGSENVYLHSKDGYADETTVIFCNACKSTVFIEDNEEEGYDDKTIDRAIEAWNRRADDGKE